MTGRVWLLNLDAELELEAPDRYGGPCAAITRRPGLVSQLSSLTRGDEILLRPPRPGALAGRVALCWSPTPQAVALLSDAGATVARTLPSGVLRAVSSRAFSARMGLELPESHFTEDPDHVARLVGLPSPSGAWLARRCFGFAGKGRRVITTWTAQDVDFVQRAACQGGVLIEPLVEREIDVSLHGFVGTELRLGQIVRSHIGPGGVWRESERASEGLLRPDERASLFAAAESAASALSRAGYRGPFGVDAFRYQLRGAVGFQPRCEVNARYSMAWALGMGDERPDLEHLRA